MIIEWLNLNFHVCMFITSLFNVLENFKDFLSLLFSNSELWILISLKKLDVDTTVNLFKLQDNHSAAVLHYIIQAAEKFVYHNSVSSAVAEFQLKKIWKDYLIRQINSFCIFFDNDQMIENIISSTQTWVLKVFFTEEEQTKYESLTLNLYKRLMKHLSDDRMTWDNDELSSSCSVAC